MSKFPMISCSIDSVIQPIFVNMKRYKVLFCDLDGTLIETVSGRTFPEGIWDMKFKMDVLSAIKKLNPDYVFIVTNQGGIGQGFVDKDNFEAKLEYIRLSIEEYLDNTQVQSAYCSSNDKSDEFRKPNIGMLNYLSDFFVGKNFDYVRKESLMIGDASGLPGQFSDSDKKTAENFGCDYMDVNEFVKSMNEYHL